MDDEESEQARVAIFDVVDTQLRDDDPPETTETLDRLLEEGHSRDEAYRFIT